MTASHLEFLVEEPSAEAFLSSFLPRVLGDRITFTVHVHQGKPDLLKNLEPRLRAYSKWLPENIRVIVLVDRDDDDCHLLKQKIETIAVSSGLVTRAVAGGKIGKSLIVSPVKNWKLGFSAIGALCDRCIPSFHRASRARRHFAIPMQSLVAPGKHWSAF